MTQLGFCEQGFDRTCAKHICKQRTKLLAFCFCLLELRFCFSNAQGTPCVWMRLWMLITNWGYVDIYISITFARLVLAFPLLCALQRALYLPTIIMLMSTGYRFSMNFGNLQTLQTWEVPFRTKRPWPFNWGIEKWQVSSDPTLANQTWLGWKCYIIVVVMEWSISFLSLSRDKFIYWCWRPTFLKYKGSIGLYHI